MTDTAGNLVANQTVTIALNYVSFGKGYLAPSLFTATINWAKVLNAPAWRKIQTTMASKGESGRACRNQRKQHLRIPTARARLFAPAPASGSSLIDRDHGQPGSAEFLLEYPRNYGGLVTVEIIATAVVAGKNNISSIVTRDCRYRPRENNDGHHPRCLRLC